MSSSPPSPQDAAFSHGVEGAYTNGYGSSIHSSKPTSTTSMVAIEQSASSNLSPRLMHVTMDGAQRRLRLEERSTSQPGSARKPPFTSSATKSMQESFILAAVRRQMEALEEKLGGQITRVQQQSDRLRDVALSRVDTKMGSVEALQPKVDRRLAELSGNYRGLSEELQAQIRRVDAVDARLAEWQSQFEEQIRNQLADVEQHHQQLASSVRLDHAANDDLFKRFNKRLLRLEGLLDEKAARADDAEQSLMNLHERISLLEELRQGDMLEKDGPAHTSAPVALDANMEARLSTVEILEAQLVEMCQRFETVQQELHDSQTRVEAQEERLRSLRTLFDTKEEHYRLLSDKIVRVDFDSKFKEVHTQLQDFGQCRSEHKEKLELLKKRFEEHDQLHDELQERLSRSRLPFSAGDGCSPGEADSAQLSFTVQENNARLVEVEATLEQLAAEFQAARADMELLPRVSSLVDTLQEIAPKVITQEQSLKELSEKVGGMAMAVRLEGGKQIAVEELHA
eukprot:TRINITY_DN101703_c0_g1_i1.p1 TRINITY_DN101703_c0_g1~~TRINITY_DN101703_c0_g1_i1.p1  ORF type:complete len:512 (-),score=167.25 TRINITY_DN101703_c0_g1_i1:214-1749(-)